MNQWSRSSPPEVFLRKGVLKICSKFTVEHPCRSVIPKEMQSNFIEITLWHVCSPVNLLQVFRTHFHKNTYEALLVAVFLVLIVNSKGGSEFQENYVGSYSNFPGDVTKTSFLLVSWRKVIV